LLKNPFSIRILTSAAKAGTEKKPVIAAVNRCATQNQVQQRLFQQPVKRIQDNAVTAALKRSTPSRQNRACWGPRRCATGNQAQHQLAPQAARKP
jgi:hypothetical protein